MDPLAFGSSPVDWCETNYKVHGSIAEFWNTVSNSVYFIIPPILMWLFNPYAQQVTKFVNVIWLMLMLVGLSSVYFHATLSLLGQLLDEIAILWVILASYATFFPTKYTPAALLGINEDRSPFQALCLLACPLVTIICFYKPVINAFLLNLLGFPTAVLLAAEMCRCSQPQIVNLGIRSVIIWVVAITCWLSDRLFCDSWRSIDFPYLHCFWHVLILLAPYSCIVVFAFIDAEKKVPHLMPTLAYWPKNSWDMGIPYVKIASPYTKQYIE